ncbi:MAG TPA: hypothetical protein VFI15_02520 [Candidatus Limnocylindrales bacterium]|nr:hypothetical protein [Candidatus Limnocylindrales bacterium]
MRPTTTHLRRRLADRLLRRHEVRPVTSDPTRQGMPSASRAARVPRAARLSRLLAPARVMPYQLRRGLGW